MHNVMLCLIHMENNVICLSEPYDVVDWMIRKSVLCRNFKVGEKVPLLAEGGVLWKSK